MIFVVFTSLNTGKGRRQGQAICRCDKTNLPAFISWSVKTFLEMEFYQFWVILLPNLNLDFQFISLTVIWLDLPLDDLSLPKSLGLFRLKKENIADEDDNSHKFRPLSLMTLYDMLFSTISWHSHPLLIIVTLTVFSWLSLSPAADCWQETHSDNSGTLTSRRGGGDGQF